MRNPFSWLYALYLIASCVACRAGWDDPLPPAPGEACRPTEVLCATQKSCCPSGQTCGGEPDAIGCPTGACCPVQGGFELSRDGGKVSSPQRPLSR